MSAETVRIRLLFVDDGSYHHEVVRVPAAALDGYERLVDVLQEEPAVLGHLHVDMGRLCAAYLVEEDDDGEAGGD